jgi:hypothetical protein
MQQELEGGIGSGGGCCLSSLRSSTKVVLISYPIFDKRLLGLTSLLVGDFAHRGRLTPELDEPCSPTCDGIVREGIVS